MRVMANLCSIVPGKVGGSEEYATRLLAAVASLRGTGALAGVEIEIAAMRGVRAAHLELTGTAWREAPWPGRSRVLRLATESTWLARKSRGFDLVHHFGGRLPARRAAPAVLTIHDIQPLDLPQNFSPAKRRYLAWALRASARAAVVVTVPSMWTAERVIDRLGVGPERVHIVPSTYRTGPLAAPGTGTHPAQSHRPFDAQQRAVGGRRTHARARGGSQAAAAAAAADALTADPPSRPFVLYPAATYPHKNHELLIAAHGTVRRRHPAATLVLTGGRGRAHAAVMRLAASTPGVIHLGRVDESQLVDLLDAATAVAIPSRYEGFGLPALEAMSVGTPVIAADATALREVVAGAGTLIGPDNIDGWIDALLAAYRGSPEIARKARRGLRRAESFAPERSASRLVEAWGAAHSRVAPAGVQR